MTEAKNYFELVKLFFSFLIHEFDFYQTKETENGNVFYDVEFKDKERVISISYENIEEYCQVIVFKLRNGKLPSYDDKTNTLHLNELNKIILPKIDKKEIGENNILFDKFQIKNSLERKLLKSAKELRLCLKHWDIVR